MYYNESSLSITRDPRYKAAIVTLDRLVAHAYAADRLGYVELTLLARQAAESVSTIERLMDPYEAAGVVRRYMRVECPCGEAYDPDDGRCLFCGASLPDATPTGQVCFAVQTPPQSPAFDPKAQTKTPDVFISYRHGDSKILAADIFYMLRSYGKSVFLDDSTIPPGDDAERDFLRAASHAGHFICLASRSYFDSEFCKSEIAHAARSGRRLIRVNVAPVPSAPPDMPWVDGPNWLQQNGSEAGLDQPLEKALLAALEVPPEGGMNLRKQACGYLLSTKSVGEIQQVWNRLSWLYENNQMGNSRAANVTIILQEATAARLPELCNALAP